MKRFEVRQFYSGYCTDIVEAEDEREAFDKAAEIELTDRHREESMSSLEPWSQCDTAEEMELP
jgi:hypothetical protein